MEKQIANPSQAFSMGASWGTPSVDNSMTSEIAPLINGSGQILYTGDIVALDVTGTQAVLTSTGNLVNVIGTVGASTELGTYTGSLPATASGIGMITGSGSEFPQTISPVITAAMGFTNGSATVTYTGAVAAALGKQILTPYNASTNATPQIFTVTAVNPGTGYTVNANFTGTTGTFTVQLANGPQSLGPGWSNAPGWTGSSAFWPGAPVPVVIRGYGRVNVNGVSTVAASDGLGGTNASVVGTRFAYAGTGYASAGGLIIAVALEAYAARDTTLTGLGIAGHDSVRAIIGKM